MHALLAHDRLQLLFVLLGVATCTWRGMAIAAMIGVAIVCRRIVRRRLADWPNEASTTGDHTGVAVIPAVTPAVIPAVIPHRGAVGPLP